MLDKLGKIAGSHCYNLLRAALNAQPQQAAHYVDIIKNFLHQTQELQNPPAIMSQAHRVLKLLESTKPTEEAMTTTPHCLKNYLPTHQQQKNASGYSPKQSKETRPYTLSLEYHRSKPTVIR